MCHLNLEHDVPDLSNHQAALDFLSNLTPGSYLYNQTVQKLRRHKRDIETKPTNYYHKKINTDRVIHGSNIEINKNQTENINLHTVTRNNNDNFIKNKTEQSVKNQIKSNKEQHRQNGTPTTATTTIHGIIKHHKQLHQQQLQHQTESIFSKTAQVSPPASTGAVATTHTVNTQNRKINTEKHLRKLKNYTKYKHKIIINSHNQTPVKVSTLILNTNSRRHDCGQLSVYALLTIFAYILFIICLYNFLFLSESAVFTVAVISAALPISGIFWSIFELTTLNNTGELTYILSILTSVCKKKNK